MSSLIFRFPYTLDEHVGTRSSRDQKFGMSNEKELHEMSVKISQMKSTYDQMKQQLLSTKQKNVIRMLKQKYAECKKQITVLHCDNKKLQLQNKTLKKQYDSETKQNQSLREFVANTMTVDMDLKNDDFEGEHPQSPRARSSSSHHENKHHTPTKSKTQQRGDLEQPIEGRSLFDDVIKTGTDTTNSKRRSVRVQERNGPPSKKPKKTNKHIDNGST